MLTLRLDALPGDSIKDVASEMCAVARRVGVPVRVKFNGVEMIARVGAHAGVVVEKYHEETRSNKDFKFFWVHSNERPGEWKEQRRHGQPVASTPTTPPPPKPQR